MITHILKAVCVLCTAACAAAAFASCGDSSSSGSSGSSGSSSGSSHISHESGSTSDGQQEELTAKEYIDKVLENFPDHLFDTTTAKGDTAADGFDAYCKKLYLGTMPDDLSDGAISYATQGGNADEVSVLKAADPDKQSELTDILKQRLDMRHHDFEGYKPEELPKIEKAKIFEAGGYSILVIADNAEDIEKAFEEAAGN